MTSIAELNELLLSYNCLRKLSIQLNDEDLTYDLILSMAMSENLTLDSVLVRFVDVSSLSLRDIGGGLTQLMHLNVTKLDLGLDRIHYELNEREDNKLFFCFSSYVLG